MKNKVPLTLASKNSVIDIPFEPPINLTKLFYSFCYCGLKVKI